MKKKSYYSEDTNAVKDILKILCSVATVIIMSIVYFKTCNYVDNKGIEYYEQGK